MPRYRLRKVTENQDAINARRLLSLVDHFGLTQHQMEVTRPVSNNNLDIFLCSNPNLVKTIEVVPGMSDHLAVLTTIDVRPKPYNKRPHKVFLYKKADFDGLRKDMSDFSKKFLTEGQAHCTKDINSSWQCFKNALATAIERHVPSRNTKSIRDLPWINKPIKQVLRRKDRLYKKARQTKNPTDWAAYCKVRQHSQKLMRTAHDTYITDVIGASLLDGGNQKKFWSYVKLNRTENIGVPILKDQEGLHITDQAKAESLNRQFVSVFTTDNGEELPDKGSSSQFPAMDRIHFTQPGLENILTSINPSKATGPDDLPARVLKEVAHEISGVLAYIFQQSYEEAVLPKDWSAARISAIYKKGDKATPVNYRPVSLTCILCKVMEHVECSQIARHLDANNILHPNQHWFRKHLSCETQLINSIDDRAKSIDNKHQTDVILLDFSKAFNKVSNRKLLHKIHHYGITSHTNNWIKAFLSGRSQQVVINGQCSEPASVLSGVPQGTVLGPMLFLLFINDITDGVNSTMRLFAYDSILYREILTPADHHILESDLSTLHRWAKTWQMDFNVAKCAILSITAKRKPQIYKYSMNAQEVPRADNHDYLGVTINNKLSWKPQISKVYSKASRTLGLIKRTLHGAQMPVRKRAYEALVRPSLEYATCAWSPHTQLDKSKLEKTQRAAARFVVGDYRQKSSVTSMLSTLQWDTLETRRKLKDATMFHKIYHGLVNIPLPANIVPADSRTRSRHNLNYA